MQQHLKKTKIVATIGPGSEAPEAFRSLLRVGVNVARTNMSHDDQSTHAARIKTIRKISKQEQIPIAILLDLSGPKIRIGDFLDGTATLIPGQEFILSGKKCVGTNEKVYFNYPYIKKDIKPGMTLMLDDGKKKLTVTRVEGTDVYTTVLVGGLIKSRRGVNIPGAYLSISALTEKDKSDAEFGIKADVDFLALSFVRTAEDIKELRTIIKNNKGHQQIIAKIETEEAVINLDAIIEQADGVMVARGDLAVEIGPEKVPSVQKTIIRKCNEVGKPVIVATQMLESMINAPVPTRAEVSDVANAIFDGADAVMLSEESALGKYAVEAVTVMGQISRQVEGEIGTHKRYRVRKDDIVDSVSSSVVHNAEDVGAKVIAAFTETGFTANMIARYKPQQPIVVLTWDEKVIRKSLIIFGCYPVKVKKMKTVAEVITSVGPTVINSGMAQKGDIIVFTAGVPINSPSRTNSMIILTI